MKEAMLYESAGDSKVRCNLCNHRCTIGDGSRGLCYVRENRSGKLYSLVYGHPIAANADPIEKKPLMHFQPGSTSYSIATVGCNFSCPWCQNWQISQSPRREDIRGGREVPPEEIVRAAARAGCASVAYTYTEPTIFFEYSYDCAVLAADEGLKNVYVTNGYMTTEMLDKFAPYLDAANVDLKSFSDDFYRDYVGARLGPILDNLKKMKELGIWVEVTTLLIPELNDAEDELRSAADFLAGELGPQTPWHISRFHPMYRMSDRRATPEKLMRRAREIGLEAGLQYVYLGNILAEEDTHCHSCGALLIRRSGFRVMENRVAEGGTCPDCGEKIPGVELRGAGKE